MEFKNKRDHVLHLLEQGSLTREQIVEQSRITAKSFGSICSTLRLMGKYPVKKEGDVYTLVTAEEYQAIAGARKEAVAKKAPVLTPEQRLEKAQKAEDKASAMVTNRKAKFEADKSRENELALKIAEMELELASIRLSKLELTPGNADAKADAKASTMESANEPW